MEAELAHGAPGPEMITAAEAYLRGGTCLQLLDVADVVLRTAPAPPEPVMLRVASLASALASSSLSDSGAAAPGGHRRMLSRDAGSRA